MKISTLLISIMSAVLALSSAGAQTKAVDFGALDETVNAELKERRTPGAGVAVVVGDRVVYAKGYGVQSVESSEPVTPDTIFRMGSTTKMLTAAALVTLADKGKIKLDAPIGDFVKNLNPAVAKVTAHQLLSQSAGIRDFASPVTSQDDAALSQNVRSWKEDVFFTEPGKIYSYSSPGYWLAGFVTEELHGKPYADAMDELLFKPLGMTRSTLRPLVAATYPLALGHNVEKDKPVVIRPIFNNVAMWPGGSVFSTVNDLSRFVAALLNGGKLEGTQALSPLAAARLPARQVTLPGSTDVWYGYGLMSFETRGVRVVSHGGASRGYGSTIDTVPAHRFAVIVLTNRSGETLPKSRMKALELALPLKAAAEEAPSKAMPLSADEMKQHVGVYTHAPQRWDILVKDGKLFLKDEGGERQLTKTGENTFSYGPSGANQIVLVAGADGQTEYLFMGLYAARRSR